jgi:hypothetical protein
MMKNKTPTLCMPPLTTTTLMLTVVSSLAFLPGCNKASEVAGNALDAGRSVATGKGGSVVSAALALREQKARQSNW